MAQVFLVNKKRGRRRSSETRAERSRAAKKGWKHRRRTNPKHTYKTRRRWSTKARKNPWYGQRRRHASAARKGWSHRRRMRRNPRGLGNINAFMKHTLVPSSVGAVGALGLDVILGYIPLPAALQTGVFKPIVRLVGAGVLGLIAAKVANRQVGENVAAGATTVILYDLFKGVVSQAAPNLPLSGLSGYPNLEFYSAGMPVGMGEYVSGALPSGGNSIVAPVGAGMPTMQEYVGW